MPTLDSAILDATRSAGPKGIGVSELIETLPVGTKNTIRSRVKALKRDGLLASKDRGRYVLSIYGSPQDGDSGQDSSDLLTYPVAPNGHGASETGRDNENATPDQITIPPRLMQRLMGGRIPPYGLWSFAAGGSMEPYIPNGFPIFIEPTAGGLIDGERYAVWLGEADADVVKRVELEPDGINLRSDNPAVSDRKFKPTEDEEMWVADNGQAMRLVIRGRVTFPPDTSPAVMGQLAEFARSLLRR